MIQVRRTVHTATPAPVVAAYLSDFTTSERWDPNTRSCRREDHGPLRVGSSFVNRQKAGPLTLPMHYRVTDYHPGAHIELVSKTALFDATDHMVFGGGSDATVVYTATFELKGPAKLAAGLFERQMNKLADSVAASLQRCLDSLPATGPESKDSAMTDYATTTEVSAPAQQLFDYLADVSNLPTYFSRMTSAEPAEGEAVHVTAEVNGTTEEGEAWFEVDRDAKALRWGSEGPNNYSGHLEVTDRGDDASAVTVTLTTQRGSGEQIQDGLNETVANIKRLVEGG
jgi:uncharacterized membrane protein